MSDSFRELLYQGGQGQARPDAAQPGPAGGGAGRQRRPAWPARRRPRAPRRQERRLGHGARPHGRRRATSASGQQAEAEAREHRRRDDGRVGRPSSSASSGPARRHRLGAAALPHRHHPGHEGGLPAEPRAGQRRHDAGGAEGEGLPTLPSSRRRRSRASASACRPEALAARRLPSGRAPCPPSRPLSCRGARGLRRAGREAGLRRLRSPPAATLGWAASARSCPCPPR